MFQLDNIYETIRKIAKTSKFQSIYANEKAIGLKLFKNDGDYTDIQVAFLNYLAFYYTINLDITLGEVDERVLDNDIFEDSYMYYKGKQRKEEMKDKKTEIPKISNNKAKDRLQTSQWVFRKPNRTKR
jgi:hypothetical protein